MAKEKNLVEDALIQMKNLEEAVAENAKGILASTMKEEIKELVKESLSEQEEDEVETEVDMEMPADDEDDSEEMDLEMDSETDDEDDSEEMGDMSMDMDTDNLDVDADIETIDLTNQSDEDVLKVFKMMKPEDEIVVTKDDSGNIHFKDEEDEYLIVTESEEEEGSIDEEDLTPEELENMIDKVFEGDYSEETESMEEMEESAEEETEEAYEEETDEAYEETEESMMEPETMESEYEEEDEGIMYEIVMDEDDDTIEESKMKMKPKGMNIGSPNKFKFRNKPNMEKGFDEKMKEGPKTMGTGKPKFTYKDGENAGSKMSKNKIVKSGKKVETKEASRTLGSGKFFRKGGLPKPRAYSKFNANIEESKMQNELTLLREKNEEYRKALNLFRDKLNEVAVFNSNLAYATRLFTEHSTSKQEKINILRRFDSVESLKESKMLYKSIKEELSSKGTQSNLTESVERKIENTASSGSAANLIESKTYENPQFLRMKDLMGKLTK